MVHRLLCDEGRPFARAAAPFIIFSLAGIAERASVETDENFFSSFLGALVALVLFFGGCAFLALVVLLALATLGQKQAASVERGSYLVFDLSANIQDAPPPFDNPFLMSPLFGGGRQDTLQLRSVTRALRAAAKDPRIAGLYLTGSLLPNGYGSGFGALKEVRAALLDFKASGKPMLAYLDFATTRDYYLASAAGDVVLDPYGLILMPGLASHPLFFAGAFEKFGIGVQVTRVGKYKGAIEPYTGKTSARRTANSSKSCSAISGAICWPKSGPAASSRPRRCSARSTARA